jgi:hypothetical protein
MHKWILIAALAATSTPAFAADPCIRHDDIRNWTALDDRTVILENYSHKKAMLKLVGTCYNLRYYEALAIRSRNGGVSCVERGDTVINRNSGTYGTCAIISITPYTGPMTTKPQASQSDPAPGQKTY